MLPEIIFIWTVLVIIVEFIIFVQVFIFKKNVKKVSEKFNHIYSPFVSIVVPFKGLDSGLEKNISAILSQNYPKKEYIFVLDNFKDPAYSVLKKFSKNAKIITSKKLKTCSGKLAALLSGLEVAKGEVLVFGDSDIRPTKTWIRELVKPLKDEKIGATTGYRWYFPLDKKLTSCIKSSWSALGLIMMFTRYAFIWGGSFAITRKKFEEMGIAEKWLKNISDDKVSTKACKDFGYKIQFVPKSIVGTFENSSWRQTKEFLTRQTYFVISYDKQSWRYPILIFSSLNFMFLTGLLFIGLSLLKSYFLIPGLIIIGLQILNPLRGYIRQKTLGQILPEYRSYFKMCTLKSALSEILIRQLTNYTLIKAKNLKEIEWRGRKYPTQFCS